MPNRHNSRATARSALIFWLVVALLFAQGIRVCLHAHHDSAPVADHDHGSTMHLESTLSTVADHDESASDVDVSLPMLLKAFYSALAFAVVLAFVFLAPLLQQLARCRPPTKSWFPFSATYRRTPPLRAPPR